MNRIYINSFVAKRIMRQISLITISMLFFSSGSCKNTTTNDLPNTFESEIINTTETEINTYKIDDFDDAQITTSKTDNLEIDIIDIESIDKSNNSRKIGDVNADGIIDAIDASAVLSHYAMTSSNKDGLFDEQQLKSADVNSNGIVDAVDASIIISYYAHSSIDKNESISIEEFADAQNK